ncbi:HAD family hydrolase [Govanella unica]|uniref:HAD family phosphatase n=1 Tax=Govanella unica TaxID=2975056 RepID=A0A9X3Z819_9PROT|nr:HAD family phosphatase [Govania unica]MDA5194880.1 HAD family phosphatase [Govania unica]
MTSPLTYDAVIFDLGGVLVDWDPRHVYRDLFEGNDWALEAFLSEVCSPDWHTKLDGGMSFAEGMAVLTAEHPHCAALIDAYDWGWPQMFRGEIEGAVDVLESLAAQGMPLYALSNFPAEKFDAFVASFPFMRHFRDVIVSGREGLTKPDLRIFELAVNRFGVTPQRTLYIDDRAENVAAAVAIGFRGHHFTGPEGLAKLF